MYSSISFAGLDFIIRELNLILYLFCSSLIPSYLQLLFTIEPKRQCFLFKKKKKKVFRAVLTICLKRHTGVSSAEVIIEDPSEQV